MLAGPSMNTIAMASDRAVNQRIARHGLEGSLRFYDGATHERMFRLPKHLRPPPRRRHDSQGSPL